MSSITRVHKPHDLKTVIANTLRKGLDPRQYAQGYAGACASSVEDVLAEIERQQPTPVSAEDLERRRHSYCNSSEAIRESNGCDHEED